MGEICTDGRFEMIKACKKRLMEATNIETRPEEMAVIDSILFRFWQMKWLPQQREPKLDEWCTDCKEYDKERHSCPRWNRVIRETLNDMPERKKGKWINYFHVPINKSLSLKRNKDLYWACSNCGYMSLYINMDITYNFCPCCGADMRGEHDD